jgi:cyclophilin family peptidyl-prolyl cis-trans isomerase
MRSVRPAVISLIFLAAVSLRAQSTVPTSTQPIPALTLAPGGDAITIDVRNYFSVPGVSGQVAQIDTVVGRYNIELLANDAPRTVANFLNYVSSGRYQNTFIHRAVTGFVIQGGGYTATVPYTHIATFAPVQNEFKLANVRGTLAMAKLGNDPNSATSEWFVNLADNRANLDNQNGGFTVFARVLGTGMTVVDAIAALPRYKIGFDDPNPLVPASTPLRNVPANETQVRPEYYVTVTDIKPVTLFPSAGGASALTVTAQASTAGIVTTVLSGSTLTIAPVGSGTTNVTVQVVDSNGNAAQSTFAVSVAAGAPVFTSQPTTQTVAAGSTVVFNASATGASSYRWERNGTVVPAATSATLVVRSAVAADAGTYVSFATNSVGVAQSAAATLTVVNLAANDVGRLVNLSILTSAGPGAKILTMGAFVGAGDSSNALPLVIRAVGPTLAQAPFNVSGALADPVMTFYAAGNTTPIDSNDNWGGGAALTAAFRSVAAFDLPATSLDSAIARTTPGAAPGGYTVQVTGKGDATGVVIAEMYDASGTARTAATPRLINLSTRAQIDTGADLAVGFVLGGQSARTVLVRGVGPSLAAFGVDGLMLDPRLELFNNNTGQRVASNDDWAGSLEIATVSASVGAFALAGGSSKDAVLLVTLPPGPYSARINGVGGTGGTALVEVYEVP